MCECRDMSQSSPTLTPLILLNGCSLRSWTMRAHTHTHKHCAGAHTVPLLLSFFVKVGKKRGNTPHKHKRTHILYTNTHTLTHILYTITHTNTYILCTDLNTHTDKHIHTLSHKDTQQTHTDTHTHTQYIQVLLLPANCQMYSCLVHCLGDCVV